MLAKDIESVPAGKFAWYAMRDAKLNSAVNSTRFTDSQKIKAERVKLAIELVYSYTSVTLDYTKKWARVKAHDAVVKDRRNLRELENQWESEGIEKVKTPQGVIYRIKRV